MLMWQEENYSGLDFGNQAEIGATKLGPNRALRKSLRGLGRKSEKITGLSEKKSKGLRTSCGWREEGTRTSL